MKIITLLWMGATLALAVDEDPAKKAQDTKTASKTANATPAPSRLTNAPVAAAQPAKRNLHHSAVPPVAPKLTPEQKAAAALPAIPQGAEEVGPNLFRYTDPQGKRWMYRNTPFGPSKWEERPGDQQAAPQTPSSAGLTMTDLGDSVQFQRLTPFGAQKWTRKKSELTDDEKAALALGTKPADAAKASEKQPEKQ
jgi:hypothetical protein